MMTTVRAGIRTAISGDQYTTLEATVPPNTAQYISNSAKLLVHYSLSWLSCRDNGLNLTSELQSQKCVQISFARVANVKGNTFKSAFKLDNVLYCVFFGFFGLHRGKPSLNK